MIKKNRDYILLLGVFLLTLFSNSLNNILVSFNPNLKQDNIYNNYDKVLEKEIKEINENNALTYKNLNLTLSRVKYRDVYDFMNTLTIYKGFLDGVSVNDAVLTNNGLVGVIEKTFAHYSVVRLITNEQSNISVKINNSIGVLKFQNNKLIVSNINNYENINIGDEVYTSGLGNIDEGIYVGKVKNIKLNNTEIEKIIEVSINEPLENINYLYIWRH